MTAPLLCFYHGTALHLSFASESLARQVEPPLLLSLAGAAAIAAAEKRWSAAPSLLGSALLAASRRLRAEPDSGRRWWPSMERAFHASSLALNLAASLRRIAAGGWQAEPMLRWAAWQSLAVLLIDLWCDPPPWTWLRGGDAAAAVRRAQAWYRFVFEERRNPLVVAALLLAGFLSIRLWAGGRLPGGAALSFALPVPLYAIVATVLNRAPWRASRPPFIIPLVSPVIEHSPTWYWLWPIHLVTLAGAVWQLRAVGPVP